jgi:hypothetical protein
MASEWKMEKIGAVKNNPNNPRIIKDDKFNKLVQSIKDFPQMLEIRPIVCNADMIVLGGNMRLKACKEAGLKEVPVIIADNLTEEQQREFIIKDNVSGGEWDWEQLANDWDDKLLGDWGLDLVGFDVDSEEYGEDFSLPEGDKEPFQQMTFTLADDQAQLIKAKLEEAKKRAEFNLIETFGNENGNGNALYALISGQL